jgi:hypothetical protein
VSQLKRAPQPLTEAEIASMRADIARQALAEGDTRTALEAMRDEGRRQRLDAEVIEQRTLSVVADLSAVPREERRAELARRAARLGLTTVLPKTAALPSGEGDSDEKA